MISDIVLIQRQCDPDVLQMFFQRCWERSSFYRARKPCPKKEGESMRRFLTVLLLVAMATSVFAAGPDEAGVKTVIQQFQQAMERHDVAAIEVLVSPDVVVWRTDIVTRVGQIFGTII